MTDDDWYAAESRRHNRDTFRHQPPDVVRRMPRFIPTLEQLLVAERWAATHEQKRETA